MDISREDAGGVILIAADAAPPKKQSRARAPTSAGDLDAVIEKLVAFLEGQRMLGDVAYPMALGDLVKLAIGTIPKSRLIQISTNKKFTRNVIVAVKTTETDEDLLQASPVCLASDVQELSSSAALLDFTFQSATSGKGRAFSAAELKMHLRGSGNLPALFQAALKERMADDNWPPEYAWVARPQTNYIFRVADTHPPCQHEQAAPTRSENAPSTARIKPDSSATSRLNQGHRVNQGCGAPSPFSEDFIAAFERLDREQGRKNFVKLFDLRRTLPAYDRATFDVGLKELCNARRFALDSSDGNWVSLTQAERDAGLREGASLLVYCSRR
jgi:hypothetical protein